LIELSNGMTRDAYQLDDPSDRFRVIKAGTTLSVLVSSLFLFLKPVLYPKPKHLAKTYSPGLRHKELLDKIKELLWLFNPQKMTSLPQHHQIRLL
jgi:hypothetical protein